MLRYVLVVLVVLSMIPLVSARPHNTLHWTIPFTGSIDVRLHAQTSTPLQNVGFSVFVSGNIPQNGGTYLGQNSINVTVNRQIFVVYQTDQCCYEGVNLFDVNVTASMVFHLSTSVPWNGTFVLGVDIE
jgi:hypothetical protein